LLEPEALQRGTKKRHQAANEAAQRGARQRDQGANEAVQRGTRQRHQGVTEALQRGTRHRPQLVTQETTGQTTTNSVAMDDATTTPEMVRVPNTQQTTLHPQATTAPLIVDPDGVGTGSYDMNSAGAFITQITTTSPMVSTDVEDSPARQATLQKETPATRETTTTLKPPDCRAFSGVKVCRVMAGFECKSENTDMGKQASLEDCVTRIKGNGGRFFSYGEGECFKENTAIDVKQCYQFQDAASCCPEMWKANTVDSWIIMADPSSSEVLAPETTGAHGGEEKEDGWFDWMPAWMRPSKSLTAWIPSSPVKSLTDSR